MDAINIKGEIFDIWGTLDSVEPFSTQWHIKARELAQLIEENNYAHFPEPGIKRLRAKFIDICKNYNRSGWSGFIDEYKSGNICGWACKKEEPDASIDVYVNGTMIAQNLRPDLPRADVLKAGAGDLHCGFSIPVPPHLIESTVAVFDLRDSRTGRYVDFLFWPLLDLQTSMAKALEISNNDGKRAALPLWFEIMERFPQAIEPYCHCVNACLDLHDFDLAEKAGIQAVGCCPDEPHLNNLYSSIAVRKGDWREAVRRNDLTMGKYPNQPWGYLFGGKALRSLGKFEEEEERYAKGVEKAPQSLELLAFLIDTLVARKKIGDAIFRAKQMCQRFPYKPDGWLRLARINAARLDWAEAENAAATGLRNCPDCLDLCILYAECSSHNSPSLNPEHLWLDVIARFPDMPEAYWRSINVCLSLGMFDLAELLGTRALEAFPSHPHIANTVASIAMRQGSFHEALKRYDGIAQQYPDKPWGYVFGAKALHNLGEYDQEEARCAEGAERSPLYPDSLAAYADVLARRGKIDAAILQASLLCERFPQNIDSWTRAITLLMEQGRYNEAEEVAYKSVELFPDNVALCLRRLECTALMGDLDRARDGWQNSKAAFSSTPDLWIGWVDINIRMENYAEAIDICIEGLNRFSVLEPGQKLPFYLRWAAILEYITHDLTEPLSLLLQVYFSDYLYQFNSALVHRIYDLNTRYLRQLKNNNVAPVGNLLLNQSLLVYLYAPDPVWQEKLFYLFANWRYRIGLQGLEQWLSGAIKEKNVSTPLAILLNDNGDLKEQYQSFKSLLAKGVNYLLKCVILYPSLSNRFYEIIKLLLDSGEYLDLKGNALYNFARIANYFNQEWTDLISACATQPTDTDISSPKGILRFRSHQRECAVDCLRGASRTRKRLSIAICVSGQLRGYRHSLDPLRKAFDLEKHDVTFFVHTWRDIGIKFPEAPHAYKLFSGNFLEAFKNAFVFKNAKCEIERDYPELFTLLTKGHIATEEDLRAFYGSSHVVIEDDNERPFSQFSNAKKMHYKKFKCVQLADEYAFDLVLWMRPDIAFRSRTQFSLGEIHARCCANCSIFSNQRFHASFLLPEGYAVDEAMAIGPQPLMNIYSQSYSHMPQFFWRKRAWGCPSEYAFHTTHEYQLFSHGIRTEELQNLGYDYLQDERIPVGEIYRALHTDIARRIPTAQDQSLLEACRKDMGA